MTLCHDCNTDSPYDITWRERGREFLVCPLCAEKRYAEIAARKGRPLATADLIEEARKEGGNPEAGGHPVIERLGAKIAVQKRKIEDLQHEVFLLKRKVDDFNTIIRPVYEEAMVSLKALVAEAQEIIRTIGTGEEVIEKAKDWLRRSENA